MKIFGAIALGLTIVILQFLVPDVFLALKNTFLLFFQVLQNALTLGQHAMQAGVILPSINI